MMTMPFARLRDALWCRNQGAIWVLDLDGSAAEEPDAVGYCFRSVRPDEASALARAMCVEPGQVIHRLAAGQRCFAAFACGEIVSYGWVATCRVAVAELEGWAQPGPAEAYVFECATIPAHRGHGLYPALLRRITAELGRAGIRRCWIGVDADNGTSQRGIARAGFHRAAEVHFRRFLGRRRLVIQPAAGAADALAQGVRRLLCQS